ncbi:MAG: hypothetical protein P8103_13295 [Candidatus Thiodiazotropha sp.]
MTTRSTGRLFRPAVVIALPLLCLTAWAWWWHQPKTPEALFRVRCSSCHELRRERLCEFAPSLRPAIVGVMRREHGADEVIGEEEAVVIETYLRERFECP